MTQDINPYASPAIAEEAALSSAPSPVRPQACCWALRWRISQTRDIATALLQRLGVQTAERLGYRSPTRPVFSRATGQFVAGLGQIRHMIGNVVNAHC